jgi:hypothetical protein
MDEWIVGRKEILAAAHRDCWDTIRNWRRLYGLKLTRWPGGQPAITRTELNAFLVAFTHDSHPFQTANLVPKHDKVESCQSNPQTDSKSGRKR